MTMSMDDMELLKLNYKNLHESVWNSHNVSWIGTSIFIPILFTVLGYLIKEYNALSISQAWMVFALTELLVVSWWLVMRILKHYNDIRIDKLKEIENIINKQMGSDTYVFKQYNLGYSLTFKERIKKQAWSPMKIYTLLLVVYTMVNVSFILTKYLIN